MSLSHPDWHLSVLTHSQLRWLCLLTQHTRAWRCGQSLSHGPWAERGPKGSGEEGRVIFRAPAAFSLHVETFRGVVQAPDYGLPCSFSPPSPLIKIIFIFITIITIYTWITWIKYCWVKGT